jgi:TRAP-type transport system periplasmic protein
MRFALMIAAAAFAISHQMPESLAQTKLRIGHITSLTSLTGQGTTKLATTAKEQSKGALEVEIYPNGQLGGELELISQVRLGTLDLAMTGSGPLANVDPTFSLTELPFVWNSADSAWQVLNGPIGQNILARLEAKGIKGLGWGVWGFRGILTNGFQVNRPDDLKGRKIRVIENPLYLKTIRAFGGNPVPMAWPEVYSALQQHTIDGVDTNYFGMVDGALQEVAKNLAVTDHIFTATVFMANLAKFQSLSPELQDVLIKAVHAAGETMRAGAAKANRDAIAVMEQAGVKITHPERAIFERPAQPVQEEFGKQIGGSLLADVKAAQK